MGYFIDDNAMEKILDFRREQFMENELPVFLRNVYLLNIDFGEIKTLYDQFIKDNFKNK